jgi:hypothetical protein
MLQQGAIERAICMMEIGSSAADHYKKRILYRGHGHQKIEHSQENAMDLIRLFRRSLVQRYQADNE